ncbi:PBSX family phage terminase large subunit [Candidatus Pacearchaeota archaeon]|nr:PBSX family phage terminase large subunit [Candidatus Pacearchaeota archaeon]
MATMRMNKKLAPLLTKKQPLIIIIGGRGSGKSIGVGDAMCMKMQTEQADIYCLREYQDSLADSVHRVFKGSIQDRLKLEGWTILENKVIAPNGAQTTYKGAARNPDSIQSAQGYKYSWFEESHRASEQSLDKLIPTIIRNPGAQCIFTANPQSSGDPFSKRFINPYLKELERDGYYEDDVHVIIVVNWRDNPWWNEEQERLRQWDYEHISRAKYDWIWEGKFNDTVENSIVKPEWFDAAIDAHVVLGFSGTGAIVCAHDPSDMGEDAKGYALRHGSVVLDVRDKDTGDVNEGCDWALQLAINENCDHFTWDCDGLGAALKRQVDQSLAGKKIESVMFKGSESPDNPEQIYQEGLNSDRRKEKTNKQTFKNKRAQYYTLLRDRFYNTYRAVVKKEYVDPDTMISLSSTIENLAGLRAEVCRIPLKPNGGGFIQIMSKIDMKKQGIASPNMADSLMMLMMHPEAPISVDLSFDSEW